jgi:hypothetical protein
MISSHAPELMKASKRTILLEVRGRTPCQAATSLKTA